MAIESLTTGLLRHNKSYIIIKKMKRLSRVILTLCLTHRAIQVWEHLQ